MRSPQHAKTPGPAPAPDFAFLSAWKTAPALVAAQEAAEVAETKAMAAWNRQTHAADHLAELRQRGETFDVVNEAELGVRRAAHETQMAQDAAMKCAKAWDHAIHEAKLATIAQCEVEFAERQRQIFLAGHSLCQANSAFYQFGQEVEKQFGPIFRRWQSESLPLINFEGLVHFVQSARWLPKEPPTSARYPGFVGPAARPDMVQAVCLKTGALGTSLWAISPGEVVWVRRDEVEMLVKQRSIKPAREGDFPMPREPLADMFGRVAVRFRTYFEARLPDGVKRWWGEGDTARIDRTLAFAAVVGGDAEYLADQSTIPSE